MAQTRQLEALASRNLSGFSLMEQAGLAIAQLAMAVKPFANCHWIFVGQATMAAMAWKPLRTYINGVKK